MIRISREEYDKLKDEISRLNAEERKRRYADRWEKKQSEIYKHTLEATQKALVMALAKKNMEMKHYTIYGLKSKEYWHFEAVGYEHGTCVSAGGESTRFFDSDDNTVFEANELIDIRIKNVKDA